MTQPGPSVAITGTRRPLLAHPDRLHSRHGRQLFSTRTRPSWTLDRRGSSFPPGSTSKQAHLSRNTRPSGCRNTRHSRCRNTRPASAVTLGSPQPCTRLASAVHPTRSQHTIIIFSSARRLKTATHRWSPRLRLRNLDSDSEASPLPPRCPAALPLDSCAPLAAFLPCRYLGRGSGVACVSRR